jgi:hypothetical protein
MVVDTANWSNEPPRWGERPGSESRNPFRQNAQATGSFGVSLKDWRARMTRTLEACARRFERNRWRACCRLRSRNPWFPHSLLRNRRTGALRFLFPSCHALRRSHLYPQPGPRASVGRSVHAGAQVRLPWGSGSKELIAAMETQETEFDDRPT